MKPSLFLLLVLAAGSRGAGLCSQKAVEQSRKLLAFHADIEFRPDDPVIAVTPTPKQLPSVANPVKKSQKFEVWEVMGSVYKAEYRLRLLYFPMGKECVLMGQEILELAKL